MNLSLINRVILGFTAITLLLLTIATSAYISQIKMDEQLEFTASTMTQLLDKANTTLNRIQDANRAVMQHANTQGPNQREGLRQLFETNMEQLRIVAAELDNSLSQFPEIRVQLNAALVPIQAFAQQSEQHMAIHDQRIKARNRALQELTLFSDEFLFFEDDMRIIVDDARFSDQQAAGWDIEYIIPQGLGAQGYLERALAVSDKSQLENYKNELNTYLNNIIKKAENIKKTAPDLFREMEPYYKLINRSIGDPEGLLQQHITYNELNHQSDEMLRNIASNMDEIANALSYTVSHLRDVAMQARTTADDIFQSSVKINVVLALISIVVAAFIGIKITRSIRIPLQAIMEALDYLSNGDLTYSIQHNFRSEMGLVAKNVNNLREKLSELISKIQQSANTINDVAIENSQRSEQTNSDINRQRTQTDLVATAVTEMEAAVQEVASHASETSNEVSKVSDEASLNMDKMGKNLSFVHELKTSLDEAADVIRSLSNESHKIGDILGVIQSIAEQTNLLALNAAIEAARAGEQGRGFAVVADEVRSLANRSQESANQISEMIETLQSQAGKAVSIVESNVKHADQSVVQTTQTTESLQNMVESLQLINDMSRSIATASEEQSSVAKDVAQNVVQISDMANNIAEAAESSSRNSDSLRDLSTTQAELVSQFRLD